MEKKYSIISLNAQLFGSSSHTLNAPIAGPGIAATGTVMIALVARFIYVTTAPQQQSTRTIWTRCQYERRPSTYNRPSLHSRSSDTKTRRSNHILYENLAPGQSDPILRDERMEA